MNDAALVLGIETSCDDTAAAVVRLDESGQNSVLSNVVWTEHDDHAAFGGVVPEIAARSHVERIDNVIAKALNQASISFDDLNAVAATAGPGLIGGVMVGFTAAKAIAIAKAIPLIPINHLEGHALSVRMTESAPFPYLLLLISGGHTQLIWVEGLGCYHRLGSTIDDAAGEAFDKTAKLLRLGQPGGPLIEATAKYGRDDRFNLPKPLAKRDGCDFSFSGMKTAVRDYAIEIANDDGEYDPVDVADLAASFQAAAARHLADRTNRAIASVADGQAGGRLVVAGGVAANSAVREALEKVCAGAGWRLTAPPVKYCTDNAAMIAWAGAERIAAGMTPNLADALALAPRARWPLAPPPKGAEVGGGRKGPKA